MKRILSVLGCNLKWYYEENIDTTKVILKRTCKQVDCMRRKIVFTIDPSHKWLPIINSFVIIKISLTNLILS